MLNKKQSTAFQETANIFILISFSQNQNTFHEQQDSFKSNPNDRDLLKIKLSLLKKPINVKNV